MSITSYVGGWIHLPKDLVDVDTLKTKLTYISPFAEDDGTRKTIRSYIDTDSYILVPREYQHGYTLDVVDKTTSIPIDYSFTKTPDPYHVRVKNKEAQAKFMGDIYKELLKCKNVLAYALTGSGKTVSALSVVPKLKQKTLVLVNTEALRDQWIEEIHDKLGVPREDIGIIQGKKNTSKDKPISVAILKTLALRDSSLELFSDFGFVILDEAHVVATEFFNDVVAKFSAKYRLALTATPEKKDKSHAVLNYHFGPIRVTANTKVMPVRVFIHKRQQGDYWGDTDRAIVHSLSKSRRRNDMLVEHIVKAYRKGRNVLAVSHAVEHVQKIIGLLKSHIPEEDIGQLTATKKINGKSVKMKKHETDEAKTKRVIVATDGYVREGIDIPQLTMGIDLVPFYNATQRIGRVRRFVEGKVQPYWITILDEDITECYIMFMARKKDYLANNFDLVEYSEQ